VWICFWIASIERSVILITPSSRFLGSQMRRLDSMTAAGLRGPCEFSAQFSVVIDVNLITAPIAAEYGRRLVFLAVKEGRGTRS